MKAVSTDALAATSVNFCGLTAPLLMMRSSLSYSFWKYSLPCRHALYFSTCPVDMRVAN
jgi:hypothetical protein